MSMLSQGFGVKHGGAQGGRCGAGVLAGGARVFERIPKPSGRCLRDRPPHAGDLWWRVHGGPWASTTLRWRGEVYPGNRSRNSLIPGLGFFGPSDLSFPAASPLRGAGSSPGYSSITSA